MYRLAAGKYGKMTTVAQWTLPYPYITLTILRINPQKIIDLCESPLIFTLTIYNWAWNICYAYLCFVRPSGERNVTNFV